MTENKDKSFISALNNIVNKDDYGDLSKDIEDTITYFIDASKKGIKNISKIFKTENKKLYPVDNPNLVDRKKIFSSYKNLFRFLLVIFFSGDIVFLINWLSLFELYYLFMLILSSLATFFCFYFYKRIRAREIRIKRYLRELGSGTVALINELALAASVDEKTVVSDILHYIKKDALKEGRLVEDNQIFILDIKSYEAYKNYKKGLSNESHEDNDISGEIPENSKGIAEIPLYMEKLQNEREGLPEDVKLQVDKIIGIVNVILEYGKNHPEVEPELRKFSSYYLPTTVALLNRYKDFMKSETTDSQKARAGISKALDTIKEGFNSLIANIQQDLVIDTKANISVLEQMLRQDGLLKEENKQWIEK